MQRMGLFISQSYIFWGVIWAGLASWCTLSVNKKFIMSCGLVTFRNSGVPLHLQQWLQPVLAGLG